jgi:hypothetical protein
MIEVRPGKLHWNYFLALERDLDVASRYVEFCEPNFKVYSIEFAHLLFAAASEVDVVAKLLCQRFNAHAPRCNIVDYRTTLTVALPELHTTKISIPRHGLTFIPWDNWKGSKSPFWWSSYNQVKHERDVHFEKATLKNALNALGALLVLTFHYYKCSLGPTPGSPLSAKETTQQLQPESTLLRLPEEYYNSHLLLG